jgi:hypothetical protein
MNRRGYPIFWVHTSSSRVIKWLAKRLPSQSGKAAIRSRKSERSAVSRIGSPASETLRGVTVELTRWQ